jgi:hypothetical protein
MDVGETTEIRRKQAETLIRWIKTPYEHKSESHPDLVGLRDQAILTVLVFTAARLSACGSFFAKLDLRKWPSMFRPQSLGTLPASSHGAAHRASV